MPINVKEQEKEKLKKALKKEIESDIKDELKHELARVTEQKSKDKELVQSSESEKAEVTKVDVIEEHKEDILVVLSKLLFY